ncbi:hypothetical protein ACIRD3_04175 [Kitasatospora sp. NPDC093550]|uniref:hypothetical protein n=1 Tax=Kitasatospora sp. NPDC093550 TaxID=3364089 RepID=UPI00381E83F2
MNTRIREAVRPPGRARRAAVGVARALTPLLVLLAGLATTVLGFSWYVDAYHRVGAHRVAPACGTPAATPGTDCVWHETGRVTARKTAGGSDSTDYHLTVARETAPEDTYQVDPDLYYETKVGADLDLTVFRNRVAELSYRGHSSDNPITPWLTSVEVALLVGLGSALTTSGLVWPRVGPRVSPLALGSIVTFLSAMGCLFLIGMQWPLAITLGVPVVGWLVLTAVNVSDTLDG